MNSTECLSVAEAIDHAVLLVGYGEEDGALLLPSVVLCCVHSTVARQSERALDVAVEHLVLCQVDLHCFRTCCGSVLCAPDMYSSLSGVCQMCVHVQVCLTGY